MDGTTFVFLEGGKDVAYWRCESCKREFWCSRLGSPQQPGAPNFCPFCGAERDPSSPGLDDQADGVKAEKIRESDNLRDKVRQGIAAAAKTLEAIIPARKLFLDDEEA